ncbi:cysteine synthase A [Haloarculaceae archaeon H-GB2-1]|nr:cysteine synthase A [Haloarculaceae archaeon H-GB1-1]MEA5386889.1 cysteine synthase A [Haloarculaceae archaeon H-GB11]MEA5408368.1 cysteine synthase A [Haloarculaceae archaeon H-GB2-1]
MNVVEDVTELIGETPLVRLASLHPNVLAKVERSNPGGSVKDRIALSMLERAAAAGALDADTTVVEPTSGNTGIGLAAVCAARGYDLLLVMPESMSEERRALLRAYGADLELTPADGGMDGAVQRAFDIADGRDDAIVLQQFENEANPAVHRQTTGPEIWEATDGDVDAIVAGVGTGGTITGVAEYLKEEQEADVQIFPVEPADSAVLSGGDAGSHGIQGIGAGFVPEVLREDLLDEVLTVTREESVETARRLASEEGILAGISSGAAVRAAIDVAARDEFETVVTVLPDTGERYLSTDLYEA